LIVERGDFEVAKGTREKSEEATREFSGGYDECFELKVAREEEIENGNCGRIEMCEIFDSWTVSNDIDG